MKNESYTAWIGLGGNIGNSREVIKKTLIMLFENDSVTLDKASSFYKTAPVGFANQSDFTNAVVRVITRYNPIDLLNCLQDLETKLGRVRTKNQFGPRIIDLDILLYEEICINLPRLVIPHPRMKERLFVLEPLLEIEGNIVLPGNVSILDSISNCKNQSIERIGRLKI